MTSGRWGQFGVLRVRSVRLLLSARAVSLLGNGMAPVALAFAILDMPNGSASALGLVLTARLLAQVVFVLFGGVLADRLPRNRVMVAADLAAGTTQAVVGLLVISGTATPLAIALLATVNGAAAALFEPASRSVMPQLVSDDALQSANGLLQISIRGGTVIGAAVAGVLVAVIGPGETLLVDAATFMISAVLLAGIRVAAVASSDGPQLRLIGQLREGWREFTARRWVWTMVLQLSFVNVLLAGGFYVLGPVVAHDHLGGAPSWGAILTAQAIGYVVGSALATRLRPRRPVAVAALMMSAFALPLFFLAIPSSVVVIAIAAFLAAICIDVFEVLLDTALQRHVPEQALSRVLSYEAVGSFALVPLGLAIAGPVASATSVRSTLLGAGALIVVTGPISLLMPSVRRVLAPPVVTGAADRDSLDAVTMSTPVAIRAEEA
ncbi:MAG: MFS transporter [Frankiaceae bacterium]